MQQRHARMPANSRTNLSKAIQRPLTACAERPGRATDMFSLSLAGRAAPRANDQCDRTALQGSTTTHQAHGYVPRHHEHGSHPIFMSEDGKEDAIHARDVLERTHGPGASSYFPEAPFDRIDRSNAAPLGLPAIAKTCQ